MQYKVQINIDIAEMHSTLLNSVLIREPFGPDVGLKNNNVLLFWVTLIAEKQRVTNADIMQFMLHTSEGNTKKQHKHEKMNEWNYRHHGIQQQYGMFYLLCLA